MGSYISRWRRKLSTIEVLEQLEKDIVRLEKSKQSDTERQKRIVASLLLYSVLIYVVAALAFYFYFMPTRWLDRIFYCLPLLIFPLLVWLIKSFLHWYFVKRIHKNDEALVKLKEKKKDILEEVMEKETYKKAKEILEKFAPATDPPLSPKSPAETQSGDETLRQRPVASGATFHRQQSSSPATSSSPAPRSSSTSGGSTVFLQSPVLNMRQQQQLDGSPRRFPLAPGPPLPRPILPRERSRTDRMMEYLIGDGPQNRYALICCACCSHNGMALREEFEYLSFRCCYCYHLNAARKQKPRAPSLDEETQEESERASTQSDVATGEQSAAGAIDAVEGASARVSADGNNLATDMDVDDLEPSGEPTTDSGMAAPDDETKKTN